MQGYLHNVIDENEDKFIVEFDEYKEIQDNNRFVIDFNKSREKHNCKGKYGNNRIIVEETGYTITNDNKPTNTYKKKGAEKMEDNKILEKYMDSVSQNIRDMEQRISEDRKESEKRITEERRLSEERIEKRFSEAMASIKATNEKIDNRIEKIESKIDSTNKWIIGICATTIIGIATIAVTVIVTLK